MQRQRKPRALTLTLPNAKQPFFVLEGKRYTLRNLSEEGVGLWVKAPAPFGLVPGAHVSGDVVIGDEIFSVGLEIRHVSANVVGFRFVKLPAPLTKIFRDLTEPSLYAASLVLNRDLSKEDAAMNAPCLCYSGDASSELLIWHNELSRMIQALQIRWLGRWVFRKFHETVKTGLLPEENQPPLGRLCQPSDLVIEHDPANLDIIHQAAQFLTSVPRPLPGAALWQFLESGEQVYLPAEVLAAAQVA